MVTEESGPQEDYSTEHIVQSILEDYNSIKPISPDRAVEKYLDSKEDSVRQETLSEYERKLSYFIEYCEREGITDLADLSGREIDGFEKWRQKESSSQVDSLSKKTMRDDLYLLRDFLNYVEKIEGVLPGTPEKVEVPQLKPGEGVRDVELDTDQLDNIIEYLSKYKYASREHVVFAIFRACGRRLGGVHSLDVSDVNIEGEQPYLQFSHHTDGRTRLKNGEKGEEKVNISQELASLLSDFIEKKRIKKTVAGRSPLITTSHGRIAKSTIRSYFYRWSRPCKIGQECPEGRTEKKCAAADSADSAPKCPASEAPHAARHGYLTEMLREGVSKEVLSDRCDVSEEILEEVYDERTDEEKRKIRRSMLKEAGVID
jgi:site-specific recombinase XerD